MKPKINQTSLTTNGVQNSVSFGIKDSGLAHIFNVLRNQLYSDKILAVVREYSCNAVDAHVEAGCGERPIEVTIPTKLNLEFKVRDFGPALSDEEIQDVYAFYGESTKRNTNEQTGMLGIGSKSAFAYGDNFVINSFIDGVKRTYNAFIDPSQVGQISKLSEENSPEENGIEIVIPVREEDVDEFQIKARDLFRHFKIQPKIKGGVQFEYSTHEILFEGETWIWRKGSNDRWASRYENPLAIMGNIAYPFEASDLNFSDEDIDNGLNDLVRGNLNLKCEIGELDISASREKLQFTDSTREALIEKLRTVREEIVKQAQKQFVAAPSLWAAKILLGDIQDFTSGLYELRDVITKSVKWKGKLIESDYVAVTEGTTVVNVEKPRRHGAVRYKLEEGWGHINASSSVVIVENDLGTRRGIMGRLLSLAIDGKKKVHVVEFENAKARKLWLKGFDGEMQKLSELEKRPLSDFYGSSSSSAGTSADPAHAKKLASAAFEFDFDKKSSWNDKNSDFWKAANVDLDNEDGIYVVIDKFKLVDSGERNYNGNSPQRIKALKKSFEDAGLSFPKNVYAWKMAKRELPENAKGWISLWDWMSNELKNYLENNNLEQKFVDISATRSVSISWIKDTKTRNSLKDGLSCEDSLILEGVKNFELMAGTEKEREEVGKLIELINNFGIEFDTLNHKPTFNFKKHEEKAKAKYEILFLLDWYEITGYRSTQENIDKVVNYINVIDICNASR